MNKQAHGFSLVELLVAFAVSALLATLLFGTFWQMSRSVRITGNRINVHNKAMRIAHQLEKDLSGACVPFHVQYEQTQEEKKKKEAAEKKQTTPQAPQQPAAGKQQEKHKPLTKLFYATSKEKKLELVTFITNNPLTMYWSDHAGKASPKIARVVYRLKAEPNTSGVDSFVLYRQESSNLDFAAFAVKEDKSKIREYKMADGIKSIECFFTIWVPAQPDSKEKIKKVVSVWSEDKKENKENNEKQKLIPDAVQLIITLWDNNFVREFSFTLAIPIVADSQFTWLSKDKDKKDDAAKPVPPKTPAASKQLPGMTAGAPPLPVGSVTMPPIFTIPQQIPRAPQGTI